MVCNISRVVKAIISGHIRPTDCPLSAPAVNLLILYTTKFFNFSKSFEIKLSVSMRSVRS